MKRSIVLFFAIFSIAFVFANKSIVIEGRIANCNYNKGSIEQSWFNPEILKEEKKYINFKIADDGSFNVKIDYPNKHTISIAHTDEKFIVIITIKIQQ